LAGLGRFIVSRLINMFVTLLVAIFLISFIFAAYTIQQKQGQMQEEYVLLYRQLQQQYRGNPQLLEQAAEQLKKNLMAKYGLTGNPVQDMIRETINLARSSIVFKFGESRNVYFGTKDIGEQVRIALKNTVILFTTATLINTFIGLMLGLYMARRPGSLLDRVVSTMGMVSYSLPLWWVGILFIIIFSFYLGWFPAQSKDVFEALSAIPQDVNAVERWFMVAATWLKYMALPLLTIVLVSFGGWAYIVRNIVLDTMHQDFVLAARARGLPERRIIYGHVLRTSSPPIVTSVALALVGSFGGAIISETVFGWPGMGLLYWIALTNGEARVLMATTFVTTLFFILTIFILDFLYVLLDPRVRTERTA